MNRVEVTSDDIIVLESPRRISRAAFARLRHELREVWPDNKIMVLEEGLTLKTLGPEQPEVDEILVEELVHEKEEVGASTTMQGEPNHVGTGLDPGDPRRPGASGTDA
jgi:hypothetical protein